MYDDNRFWPKNFKTNQRSNMKYIKLKSLTWWSSVAEALVNLVRVAGYPVPYEVDAFIACAFGVGIRGAMGE